MAPGRLSDFHTKRDQPTPRQLPPKVRLRFDKWERDPLGRATLIVFLPHGFTEYVEDMNAPVPFGGDIRHQLDNTVP